MSNGICPCREANKGPPEACAPARLTLDVNDRWKLAFERFVNGAFCTANKVLALHLKLKLPSAECTSPSLID